MKNKFLFIQKKKVIAILIVAVLLIVGIIAILIKTQSTDSIQKIANTEELKAQKEDLVEPTVEFSMQGNSSWQSESEVKVNVVDNEDGTGIDEDSLKYLWRSINIIGTFSEDEITESFVNGEIIPFPQNVEGEYNLYVQAKDIAGNSSIVCTEFTFKINTKAP